MHKNVRSKLWDYPAKVADISDDINFVGPLGGFCYCKIRDYSIKRPSHLTVMAPFSNFHFIFYDDLYALLAHRLHSHLRRFRFPSSLFP